MSVTYAYPSTTVPTVANNAFSSAVVAQVVMADTDTSQAVLHKWSLSTAQQAALMPWVQLRFSAVGATPLTVLINLTDSDTVTISKASGTGSAFTGVVVIQRPHSILAQIPILGQQ